MKARSRACFLLACCLMLGVVRAGATIEGRWLLVRETLGEASSNRVDAAEALHLDFEPEGDTIVGRAWFGNDRGSAASWPGFAFGGAEEFEIESVRFTDDRTEVRAVYTMRQAGSTRPVKVIEAYRVVDGGEALTGSLTLLSGQRVIYKLRRRFERRR